ncbi:MAG: cellulase family glycosylhydrolase [Candidatus Sumerlaeota bacterium]|nr:cellulase family glycosylhydrolase [Candidatus Sumerlaeota bacterium]
MRSFHWMLIGTVSSTVALGFSQPPGGSRPATRPGGAANSPTSQEAARLELRPGEFFFRVGGKQAFVLGKNPVGKNAEEFEPLFDWAVESGERLVRIHVTTGPRPAAAPGEVDEAWARRWDAVFDLAAEKGLAVLPVLAIWTDWNDGARGELWHYWDKNRFNAALGGPARAPADLLADTECRRLWLQWLEKMVRRWQDRDAILGWEVFSELNLITGASELAALEFTERAAAVIRAADSRPRPVTASLAGIAQWSRLFESRALDFIQIHPYALPSPFDGNLDRMILESVRARLRRYGKPVFIGESGLDARGSQRELVVAPRAEIGIRHAIWAAVVSGAMNGRMLWWEDGYDRFSGTDLRTRYKDASAAAARFVAGVDFAGFQPLEAQAPEDLFGGAIGNERAALGWFRDARCVPPDWPTRLMEGAWVDVSAPGDARQWEVEFWDTARGAALSKARIEREGPAVRVSLPPFEDSIAWKLTALSPAP